MELDLAEHSAKISAIVSQSALCLTGFSINFLLMYYVLRHSHPPRPLKVAILVIALYLPSFAQMVTLPFARLPSDAVKASLSPFYQNLEKYDFTGTPSMGNLFADYGTWYPMIMPFPCYAFILIVRYKILRQLRASGSQISERTKELHIQLVRTLTYHACLPFFVVIADAMFTVLLMDVYRHPLMENFIATIPACLSPIFTMVLIRPYRA
ncbi:hypothetical protein PRIPAC_86338 [Pristionchus pacificus]|nr:hypothetical protein PRIPAC_86338 [Pristionchus pacificus]